MSASATVEDHNLKVAPTLTPGKITPEVLHRWERSCKEYFRVKNVSEKKKVESVLSRLQDFRIADWAEANEATLVALNFKAFMDELRGEALEKDWDRKIKLSILASKQEERPFHEWAYEILNRNALLRGRPHHFSDGSLRETLENNMDQGLELRARKIVLEAEASLRDWIEAVKAEGEFVAREREMAKEVARELYRRELKGAAKSTSSGRTMGTRVDNTVAAMPRSTASSSALPKLTPSERSLIFDHQGCFKCRQLYVDHKGANCPNGFPPASTYKTLTAEYAEAVRDSKNRPRSRAPGPVAHVGYTTDEARTQPSAVLGLGDEDSDDSSKYVRTHHSTPFSSGHLEWRCRVDGPSVSEPAVITALIDNGSHSVLVDDGLVARLGLRRRRLPTPQRARLAMGEEEVVFSEWVKLRVCSEDSQWTARTV